MSKTKIPLAGLFLLLSVFLSLSQFLHVFVSNHEWGSSAPSNSLIMLPRLRDSRSSSAESTSSRVPRVLLGITGRVEGGDSSHHELKRRVILRKTYLNFDKVHNTTTPHRICSLRKFSSKPSTQWRPYECQLVYTFVFGGGGSKILTKNSTTAEYNLQSMEAPVAENITTWMERETLDKDYLFLNVDDQDDGMKLWSWYQYAQKSWQSSFDFVAATDTTVLIHPPEFWQNPIFSSFSPSHSNQQNMIYGGFLVSKPQCDTDKRLRADWCPSLQGGKMTQRFTLLSMTFLNILMQKRVDASKEYQSLQEKESVDVGLANIIHEWYPALVATPLAGVKPVLSNQRRWSDFLKQWDKYKDTMVQYTDSIEEERVRSSSAIKYFDSTTKTPGPRLLLGIFTMDNAIEKERRAAVRETYLAYYNDSPTPDRICSLSDLLSGSLPNNGMDCQMAYTFVLGSNPEGHTELVSSNTPTPILCPQSPMPLKNETDITHLNIRENMEDGKSPTWFNYAMSVVNEKFYFDYIGKIDTDTLILPNGFLDVTFAKYPSFPENVRVFGGQERLKYEWGPRMVGPLYMGGHLYWMSVDLARYVTTVLDRRPVDVGIEDMSMGNFIHSHPLPIQRKPIVGTKSLTHPLKNPGEYRQTWLEKEKEERLRLVKNKLMKKRLQEPEKKSLMVE